MVDQLGTRTLLDLARAAAGEPDDGQDDANEIRRELIGHGELFADFGLGPQASQLRRAGSVQPSLAHAPMIIDTDVGGDPDDAVALAIAARKVPELALVITSDEREGARGRFARYLLDSLGRSDVPVVSGRQLTDTRYFCVDGLTPAEIPPQPTDVAGAARSLGEVSTGPIRWVGIGPASNLSDLVTTYPEFAGRLVVTQMGGAIHYRTPDRAEHNFRLDPDAAGNLLSSITSPHLVVSDVTFRPEIEVSAETQLYRRLAAHTACRWQALLKANFDRWFAAFHPTSMLHDPLTLSAALQLPHVDFSLERVAVGPDGRMRLAEEGRPVFVSRSADYDDFTKWVGAGLGAGRPTLR